MSITAMSMQTMAWAAHSPPGHQQMTPIASYITSLSESSLATATGSEVPRTSQPLVVMWPTLEITLVMYSGESRYAEVIQSGLTD